MHHSAPPPPPPPYGAEVKPADMFAYAPSSSLGASTASGYSAAPGSSPLYPHCPAAGVPLLQPFLNPFATPNGNGATAVPVAAPLLPSLVTSAPLSLGQPHAAAQQPQPQQQAAQQFYPMSAAQLQPPAHQPQLQTNLLSQQQLQQLQIQLQLQQLQQQQQQIQQLQQQQQQQQQQYAALQQRLAGNSQAIMLVPIGVDQTGVQQFLPQLHPGFHPSTAAAAGGLALPPECPMSRHAGFNALGALGGGVGVPLIPAGGIAPTPPPLAALPAHAAAAAAAAAAAQFHGATPTNGSITSYRNTGLNQAMMGGVAPPGMQRCPVAHDSASRTAAHNHRSSLRQRRRQALIADYEKLETAATAAGAGDPNFFVPLTGDVHRQALQRRKQVLFGRATRGYIHYLLAVPPTWRQRAAPAAPDAAAAGGCPFRHGGAAAANGDDAVPLSLDLSASFSVTGRSAAAPAHPRTPRSDLRCSKRSWDAVVGRWRAQLRQWDNPLFAADAVGTALKAFGVEPPGLTPVRESPQTATGTTAANAAPAAPRATGCPVLAAINEAEKAESVRSGGSTPSLSAGSHVGRLSLGGSAHPLFPAAYVRRLYPHVVHFLREVQRLFPPRSDGPEGEAATPVAKKQRRAVGDESSEDEEESMSQSSVSAVPPQQRVSLLPADIEALFAALGRVEEPDDADDERIVAKHRAVERLMEELSRAVMDASSALTES